MRDIEASISRYLVEMDTWYKERRKRPSERSRATRERIPRSV